MDEIWAFIPSYEGLYEASNYGRIRTAKGKTTSNARYKCRVWKQRVMKQKLKYAHNRKRADAMVCLWKDGKPSYHLVARLIAATFCGNNLYSSLTVNHKDGNTLNNRSENLEWMTNKENIQYGFRMGQYRSTQHPITIVDGNSKIYMNSFAETDRWLKRYRGYTYEQVKRKKQKLQNSDGKEFVIASF